MYTRQHEPGFAWPLRVPAARARRTRLATQRDRRPQADHRRRPARAGAPRRCGRCSAPTTCRGSRPACWYATPAGWHAGHRARRRLPPAGPARGGRAAGGDAAPHAAAALAWKAYTLLAGAAGRARLGLGPPGAAAHPRRRAGPLRGPPAAADARPAALRSPVAVLPVRPAGARPARRRRGAVVVRRRGGAARRAARIACSTRTSPHCSTRSTAGSASAPARCSARSPPASPTAILRAADVLPGSTVDQHRHAARGARHRRPGRAGARRRPAS